jgi:hypothetical protein
MTRSEARHLRAGDGSMGAGDRSIAATKIVCGFTAIRI